MQLLLQTVKVRGLEVVSLANYEFRREITPYDETAAGVSDKVMKVFRKFEKDYKAKIGRDI